MKNCQNWSRMRLRSGDKLQDKERKVSMDTENKGSSLYVGIDCQKETPGVCYQDAQMKEAQVLPLAIQNAVNYVGWRKPRTTVQVGAPFGLQEFMDDKNKLDAPRAADFAQQQIEKML